MDRHHKAYYEAFVLSLVVCWSPSNVLGYASPCLALLWFFFRTGSRLVVRNVALWLFAWVSSIVLHALFVQDFAFHSAVLSILTYSAFAVVVVIPSTWLASSLLLERMQKWACRLIVLEAIWGIVQAFYAFLRTRTFDLGTGDVVEGTIHPALASERSLSNPMFSLNMAFLLIAILPSFLLNRTRKATLVIGAMALILASTMHVMLLAGLAFAIALLIYRPLVVTRKAGCVLLIGGVLLSGLVALVLPRSLRTWRSFIQWIEEGEFPRATVTLRAVVEMPKVYPLMPLFGLGPGQFSSRAGLIGTGLYFGGPLNPRPLPLLPTGMSKPFRDNVLDLWSKAMSPRYGSSSIHKPFYSVLSVYTEMGALVLFSILLLCALTLFRVRSRAKSYRQRVIATCFGTALLLLLFVGTQENYWEVPQAILPGIMLLKALYAKAVHLAPSQRQSLGPNSTAEAPR